LGRQAREYEQEMKVIRDSISRMDAIMVRGELRQTA
jgi:hypothetical protein